MQRDNCFIFLLIYRVGKIISLQRSDFFRMWTNNLQDLWYVPIRQEPARFNLLLACDLESKLFLSR